MSEISQTGIMPVYSKLPLGAGIQSDYWNYTYKDTHCNRSKSETLKATDKIQRSTNVKTSVTNYN